MPGRIGAGRVTNTTTSNSQPWSGAQPYIETGLKGAKKLLTSGSGFAPYQGQLVAGFSPQSEAAMQGIETLAGAPNPLLSGASGAIQGMLSDTNPGAAGRYLTDYASGANVNGGSPQFNAALNFQSGQLADDVNRGFSGMGRYGSGAHTGVLGDQIGQFRNQALSQEIQRQQGMQLQAAGMISGEEQAQAGNRLAASQIAPQLYAAQYAPYEALGQVGAMRDQRTQAELDAEAARWEQGQNADWQRLNAYTGSVAPFTGLGGNITQQTTEPRRPFATALGGLATGAGIMGSLATGGWGFPLLSGLGLMASDERVKEDIERVGETDEGEPLFKYKYRGDPTETTHVGVIAQHLAETQPEAVHRGPHGMLLVDYSKVR